MNTAEMIAAMPPGMLDEIVSSHVLGIKGRVSVEIVDDRTGRVVASEDADNYVNTAMWQEWAKYAQKTAWTVGYQGDTLTVTNRALDGRDPRQAPSLRNDVIAAWTDTTAENTADLYPFGEVVAWAHRWQQGSPSTRQGVVQPTLCTLTDTAVSWVWEWATPNGNGTFQSVGWRRLTPQSNSGDTALPDNRFISPRYTGGISNTGIVSSQNHFQNYTITSGPGASAVATLGAHYYDGASLWFVGFSTSVTAKLYSVPVTIDGIGNYSLGAVVDQSAAAFAAGLKVNAVRTDIAAQCNGITRLGTSGDWIGVGAAAGSMGTSRRPYIARVTNAGVTTYTNVNAGTYSVESSFMDVTYDGTDIWVVAEKGNNGTAAMHRINPATGTISATVTAVGSVPAYFPQWGTTVWPVGIEWEAATSTLWIQDTAGYVYGVDTSGVWNGVLLGGGPTSALTYPISTATLSGQHNGNRAANRGSSDTDSATVVLDTGAGVAATQPWNDMNYGGGDNGTIVYGRLRLCSFGTNIMCGSTLSVNPANSTNGLLWTLSGLNRSRLFASRSLLGASVTKNNTQTMRIRYTLTFT